MSQFGRRVTGRRAKLFFSLPGTFLKGFLALTPDASFKTFTSPDEKWASSFANAPCVRMNGVLNGGGINPTLVDDEVAVEETSGYLAGAEFTTSAGTLTVARPASDSRVSSITIDSGGALAVVAGADGVLSSVRGAAGGPPLIPTGSIELGLVTYTSTVSAPVLSKEIDQGSMERADLPLPKVDFLAGAVEYSEPLPAIHTGPVAREVYAQYRKTTVGQVADFRSADISFSTNRPQTDAAGDDFTDSLEDIKSWTISGSMYLLDPTFIDKALEKDGEFYIQWQRHENDSWKLEGRCGLDLDIAGTLDAGIEQNFTVQGKGPIRRVAA